MTIPIDRLKQAVRIAWNAAQWPDHAELYAICAALDELERRREQLSTMSKHLQLALDGLERQRMVIDLLRTAGHVTEDAFVQARAIANQVLAKPGAEPKVGT